MIIGPSFNRFSKNFRFVFNYCCNVSTLIGIATQMMLAILILEDQLICEQSITYGERELAKHNIKVVNHHDLSKHNSKR
jgi:hypothetical protein